MEVVMIKGDKDKTLFITLEVKINFEFKKGVGITIKSKEKSS